jgi:1,2-diacylglycerol 3-alpha-glucosyltransferase
MFGDQHAESFGGAQVSMRLQRRFLEKAGHTVTIVAPARHGARRAPAPDPASVDLPSVPVTLDREYAMTWPGARTDRRMDAAMRVRPKVDIVHVQADFWGAFIGHRFAERHGLPVVHTMHNRVDVGIEATTPFPGAALRVLNAWERRAIGADSSGREGGRGAGRSGGRDGWAYLRGFAERADAVTAPSSHFARRLEAHGVVPGRGIPAGGERRVDVVWNGIDDDLLEATLASRAERAPGPPRLVWLGRMSPEKRLLPFLEALAASRITASVEVLGGGGQRRAAQRLVDRLRPQASVVFAGRMPYSESLRRLAAADALVQTSIGFETQGMTPFEAASLGTPSIVSDPDIATELGSGLWAVPDASIEALAETLRRAAAEIEAGTAPVPDIGIRESFRQSSRTAAMIEVYQRVLRA